MKTISIISPCFNEADNVRACYNSVRALFAKGGPLAKYRCEHIFADNASSDGTVEILRELAAEDPSNETARLKVKIATPLMSAP